MMFSKLLFLTLTLTLLHTTTSAFRSPWSVLQDPDQGEELAGLRDGMPPLQLLPSFPMLQEALKHQLEDTSLNSTLPELVGGGEEDLTEGLGSILTVWSTVETFYVPKKANIDNEECAKDVSDRAFLLNINKLWIMRMIDSWGKLTDGFLFGNVRATGMFEECVQVEAHYNFTEGFIHPTHTLRNYTGRYCTVYYLPKLKKEKSGVAFAVLATPLPFSYGTCIPSTCTTEDMQDSVNVTLEEYGMKLVRVTCHADDDPEEELIPEDKAMLSILGVLGCLLVLASIYDLITSQLGKEQNKACLNFSLYRNMQRIFTYDVPKGADVITCLPALRVVTMTWIIICHQYETNYDFIVNTLDSLKYQDPVLTEVVTNGWLSVDTFLFMTGLVLSYRLLPLLADRRPRAHLSIFIKTFFRRFFRLAPTILCVALFCASLLRFLGRGPRKHLLDAFSRGDCATHWWKDPLFFNNFITGENHGLTVNDCLDNCWYTAVDMQLLLILPLMLLPVVYFGLPGLMSLTVATVGSVLVPLILTIVYNLPPVPIQPSLITTHFEYMWRVYLVPWCRAGPWLVGVWTAFFLRRPNATRINIPKVVVVLGYVAAIALGLVLVLGLYPYNHVLPDKNWKDYPAMSAIYGALARPVWGMCLAWVVISCHTGNAGLVNHVLSYPGWRPLARLTFTMYLVAPVVQLWWSTFLYLPTHFDYLSKLFESLGVIFIAGVVGVLLTCLVELPVSSLANMLLPYAAANEEQLQPVLEMVDQAPKSSHVPLSRTSPNYN
nr:nose resistant to fluoxetine protein 6-like [Procambarus clarkii]